MFLEGTNALIVLDDCAALKDVKRQTGELVKLDFFRAPCRHQRVDADPAAVKQRKAF